MNARHGPPVTLRKGPPVHSNRNTLFGIALIMLAAAVAEFWMGRKHWGVSGVAGLWSGDIWSSYNSQFLADPYTFTHITHGILLFAFLTLVFRALPLQVRLLMTAGLESAWEVLENSSLVIERYRAETISLNYYGDSIVNSMGDVLACLLGFFLASQLPNRVTVIATISLEILLVVWTRDNLTLNIIMLLHPSPMIRSWQLPS